MEIDYSAIIYTEVQELYFILLFFGFITIYIASFINSHCHCLIDTGGCIAKMKKKSRIINYKFVL
jgi:hypothetical protein